MAYDETWAKSTTAGPVASYPWVRDHAEKMLQEVPSHKLVLGIPFYTRIWHESGGVARGETLAIKNESSYFTNYASNIIWNDTLKSYYAAIPTTSGTDKIWFEDNKSLGYKLNLVKELQLAGFAAWRKGFEDESTIAMIQGKDLGRGIPKSPTAVAPEPVVEETKPLTKLEQYKLRLEEKEKAKADKDADKTAKEGEVKDAEQTIKDAEEKLKTAQYPTDVVLTPEWRDKAKELIHKYKESYPEPYPDFTGMDADQIDKAGEAWRARYDEWVKEQRIEMRRLQEELSQLDKGTRDKWTQLVRNIITDGLRDEETDVKYDPNNLPQDVVDELNDRFITLLNSLRKQLNLPEAKINTNNKDFAKEVAKIYKDNDYQGDNHFGRGINDVARKRGLVASEKPGVETTGQYYENLMNIPMRSNEMTKRALVEELSNSFITFFAEGDLTGSYGHFFSLLTADNLGLNTSMIKGGQMLNDIGSQYLTHVLRIHVLNVENADSIDNADTDIRKAKFDELYGPNSKANLPTPTLQNKQEVEAELEKAKADKKTAEDNLEQVKTELQEIEKRIADLEKEVSETPAKEAKRTEAVKELEKAKEKAEDAKRKLEHATLDDNAKNRRLEKARKAKEEADKELAKKLAESQQKDKDLENAKIERLKADKELKDAKDALQKAKDKLAETLRLSQEKAKLEEELKAKSKELDELGKHVDDLKRDVKQKEDNV